MKAYLTGFIFLLACACSRAQEADTLLKAAHRQFEAKAFRQADSLTTAALQYLRQAPCSEESADAAALAGACAVALQAPTRAQPLLQEALHCLRELHPGGSAGEVFALIQSGRSRQTQALYDEAIADYESALALQQRLLPAGHPDLNNTFFLLGWTHLARSTYNEATDWLEKAAAGYTAVHGENSAEFAPVLEKLSQAYLYNGRYTDALAHAQKLLALQQKLHPASDPAIAKACVIVGTQYKYMKKYPAALRYFNDALNIYQQAEKKNYNAVAECYAEIGQVYLYQKNYPKALATFRLEDETMIAGDEHLTYDYAYTCTDLGKYYLATGNYPEAMRMQQKAVDIALAHSSADNTNLATFYLYLGRTQAAMGQYPEAVASFQANGAMLERLYGDGSSRQYHNNGELGYTYLCWYLQTKDNSLLEKSRGYFRQFEADIDRLMQTEILPEAQQKLRSESLIYCERAILAELEVLQLHAGDAKAQENAWQLSEKMHGFMLQAATQEARARHFSGLPDSLLEQDNDLQQQFTLLDKKRRHCIQTQKMQPTDSLVVALEAEIARIKATQTRLRRRFETQYPEYYRLKYSIHPVSIAELRQNLENNQTFLEYFVGDSTVYVFEISAADCNIHRLPVQTNLRTLTEQCLRGITAYHGAPNKSAALYRESTLQYAEAAQNLYDKLWRPLGALGRNLILAPGEYLAGLPFEVLLSAPPALPANFSTYPFLLKKHDIQYAYSATMWLEMKNRRLRETPTGDVLAFAPFCGTNAPAPDELARIEGANGWTELPYSDEEADAVTTHFAEHSRAVTGREATKALFARLAAQYRIIHLATHGKADAETGDDCFVAFAADAADPDAGLFTAAELYNFPLNAAMVVLSACETGLGEQLRGEGVAGVARAFAYAGAKSIVASLWSVGDQSTMYIMDEFYAGLKAGKTKPAALAAAKRNYLEKHPGTGSHPFFWAAFVGLGDGSAIAP